MSSAESPHPASTKSEPLALPGRARGLGVYARFFGASEGRKRRTGPQIRLPATRAPIIYGSVKIADIEKRGDPFSEDLIWVCSGPR